MKKSVKHLSVLLAIVLCAAIFLTACDALSLSKVKKDPSAEVLAAIARTSESIYGDSDILKTISAAISKGSTSINVNIPASDSETNFTVYSDKDTHSFAFNMAQAISGTEYSNVDFFFDGKSVAVKSDLINDGTAIGTDLTKLPESFKDSPIFELFDSSYDDFADMVDKYLNNSSENSDLFADFVTDITDVIKDAEVEVTDGTADIFGASPKAITVKYTFSGEVLVNLMKSIYSLSEFALDLSSIPELPEIGDGDSLDISFLLNPVNGMLMEVRANAASDQEDTNMVLTLGETPAESTKFAFNVKDGDEQQLECVIDRGNTDTEITRLITITDSDNAVNTFGFTYDKSSGDISATIDGDSQTSPTTLTGNLTAYESSVEIQLADDEVKLALKFKQDEAVPEMPDYDDIADMDIETLQQLIMSLYSGSAGSTGDLGGLDGEYDYYGAADFDPTEDYDMDGDCGDDDDYSAWEEYNEYIQSFTGDNGLDWSET